MKRIILPICLILISILSCNKKIKINLYTDENQVIKKHLEKKITQFNRDNQDIKIIMEIQKTSHLKKALVQNKADLIRYSSDVITEKNISRNLIDCRELFNQNFFHQFQDNAIQTVTVNNKINAIPDIYSNQLVLFYNKKMIASFPGTKREFNLLIKSFKKKYPALYLIAYNQYDPYSLYPFFSAANVNQNFIDHFHSKKTIYAFRMLKKFIHQDKIIPLNCDFEKAEALFLNHQSAMLIADAGLYQKYKSMLHDELKIADFPRLYFNQNESRSWITTKGYAVNKSISPKKLPVVKNFIQYMTNDNNQKNWLSINEKPVSKNVLAGHDSLMISMAQKAHAKPDFQKYLIYYKAIYDDILKFYACETAPEKSIMLIEKKIKQYTAMAEK